MQIQCPACKTRAQIPESQEGAKVRCGSCGRVYVARAPGTRNVARQSSNGMALALVGGVVGLSVLTAIYYGRAKESAAKSPVVIEEIAVEDGPVVDYEGWQSGPVKTVRQLYAGVQSYDKGRVKRVIDVPELWDGGSADDYLLLDGTARLMAEDELLERLLNEETENALKLWNPIDGHVLDEDDSGILVHVQVDRLDISNGLESRTMAFRVVPDKKNSATYHVVSWERFISPEEERARIARKPKAYEKVELSDGSKVYEAEPAALEHLDETPAELRTEIDQLFATMINLDLTTEAIDARSKLIEIGKPALPVLLTGLYEIPLDTQDQGIQVNHIVIALRQITGQYHGYKPMELAGSTTGTTRERRESSIKQWFAWWHRKGASFEGRAEPEVDPLEALIELDEREKRLLERDRRSGG